MRRVSPSDTPPAIVASMDAWRDVPAFVWAPEGAPKAPNSVGRSAESAARWYLARYAPLYKLPAAALETVMVRQVHDTGRGGVIVTFGQEVDGAPVFNTELKVLMRRDLSLVALAGNLHASAVRLPPGAGSLKPGSAKSRLFSSLKLEQAVARAVHHAHGAVLKTTDLAPRIEEAEGGYRRFDLAQTAAVRAANVHFVQPARARNVLFPLPDRVIPGYFVEVSVGDADSTRSHAFAYIFAADDGRQLYRENLSHAATFNYRVWAETEGAHTPLDGPLADFSPHPTGEPDGFFPSFIAPNVISIEGFNKNPSGGIDAWLPANATTTRGNNVDAYADHRAPDGFSNGDVRAAVTAPGAFDHLYDTSAPPLANEGQVMAAVTQIFYVTNWLHDWYYDSGFNEAAGNAQFQNFGRGGLGGDPLLAEAQDDATGNSRDNANMDAMYDGAPPRMQMYLWTGPDARSLSASPLNASFASKTAAFGPLTYELTGELVLAEDAAAPANDACGPITNDVAGKIVLADRGGCPFVEKAQNAQSAGAIGLLIANNVASDGAPTLGGSAPSVVTPTQSVSREDGTTLKAALEQGPVSVTMTRESTVERDGTIDNTIVAHEWGHYIHLRLVRCGSSQCGAQSEGWGDFLALHMVIREGDDLDGAYPLSSYGSAALGDSYFGIRRAPYSVDVSKNGLTFKHIADGERLPDHPLNVGAPINSEVHNAGEVWASMMHEAYIALIKQSQAQGRSFEDARRRMSDYVVGGMKLAPTNPTYTQQRDAILAAALATDEGDFVTLAEAFARRGAGTCAESPSVDSRNFTGVVESFGVQPEISLRAVQLDDSEVSCDKDGRLDAEETGKVTIEITNTGTAPLTDAMASIASAHRGVSFPSGASVSFGVIPPFGKGTATIAIQLDGALDSTDGTATPGTRPTPAEDLKLDVTLKSAVSCTPTRTEVAVRRVNFDELLGASRVDDVEAETTTWTVDGLSGDLVWARAVGTAPNRVWRAVDFASLSDTALVSPELKVSETEPFVLTFTHRHQFETGQNRFWDGAVLEITSDGGETWTDISTLADPGYGGTINDEAGNPLSDRRAYVGTNPSWPGMDQVKIELGTALAGKTVQVRFRVGTDEAAGEFGWEIDDIGFAGVTSAPFPKLVQDAATCGSAPAVPEPEPKPEGQDDDDDDVAADAPPPLAVDDGCACRAAGGRPLGPLAPLGSLAAIAAFVVRRRRKAAPGRG